MRKHISVVELPVSTLEPDLPARVSGRDSACVEFELALAEVLRRDQLPPAARAHLSACPQCAAMLDDFETIAGQVRQLSPLTPAESDPVPNQWLEIRDALRREGIIHDGADQCAADTRALPKLVQPASTTPQRG